MKENWRYRYKHQKQAEILKEFEGWKPGDFIDHILELREAIIALEAGDKGKTPVETTKQASDNKAYKQEWSYPTKIHFLLYQQQKPLTAEDLHDLLLKVDAHYKDYDSPTNNLNVSVARMVKSGRVKRIKQPGLKKSYLALPEWVDMVGKLLPNYAITQFFM